MKRESSLAHPLKFGVRTAGSFPYHLTSPWLSRSWRVSRKDCGYVELALYFQHMGT